MPPRNSRWRFHGLKKPKIRQDWNKFNFYNLAHLSRQKTSNRTYFQQKWTAKATTRAYHGEHINEKRWQRLFSKIVPAVVPMDPKYLADNDGSEHASGRGSGKELNPLSPLKIPPKTPYMQMVYHPTERRLDTAIFRALFASSARQARQHVVHGHVKVNGKKMIYPGYLLNPGDMFSVKPERVLNATGALVKLQQRKRRGANLYKAPSPLLNASAEAEESHSDEIDEPLTEEESNIPSSDTALANTKRLLLRLRERATELLETPPKGQTLSAQQKQDLRAFKKTVKQSLSRASNITPSNLDDLETEYQILSSRIIALGRAEIPTASEEIVRNSYSKSGSSHPLPSESAIHPRSTPEDSMNNKFNAQEDSGDPSQHWRPKNYMSPFAFIPRFLEVNHSVCSAVYLRHPVCRPGFAEVPTPFHSETGQLAFNWYLRRR